MDQRLDAVIVFIKANLHRKLTPTEIADSVHLSVSRMRQLIKTETGTPLSRYLRELRLERAKQLLETTFLSVKEITSRVGIAGISHFVRDFKKAYRMTPTRYATRYRKATHMP